MRPLPFFLRSIQIPLFLALLHRGTRCVPTKMSLYCHAILLKNEQKFAKIRKRLRVRKSEKGLKIKGFQGFCANEEIIVTMLPKLATRVRFPSSAPKNSCKIIWFCNYFSFFERFCSPAEFENVTLWEADSVTFMYKGKGLPVTSSSPSKYFLLLFDFVLPPFEKIFRADTVLTSELGSWKPSCFQYTIDYKARNLEQLRHIADRQKCAIFG